jgi:hypothetical protein
MAGRGSKPGERRGGRQKGTGNKVSTDVKTALLDALHAAPGGAAGFFSSLRESDPKAFATLVGKLLPQTRELTGAQGDRLIPDRPVDDLELAKRIAYELTRAEILLNETGPGGVKP